MTHRVAVTGLGVVTPLGHQLDVFWNSLVSGQCGIDRITAFDPADYACQVACEVPRVDGRGGGGPGVPASFDPDQVMALRELMPQLPRGIIAERAYEEADWPEATPAQRQGMLHLRHGWRTRPHFVAYWVDDLPAAAPWIARNVFGCPLLTWTVRTPEQRAIAARDADQMIFEGFRPET